MSSTADQSLGACQNTNCVDVADVRVRFSNGEERIYCRHHAEHIAPLFRVEVIE